jgi:hypothetical protein
VRNHDIPKRHAIIDKVLEAHDHFTFTPQMHQSIFLGLHYYLPAGEVLQSISLRLSTSAKQSARKHDKDLLPEIRNAENTNHKKCSSS